MNGLKHGLRSKKLAVMREESLAFENRKLRWLAHSDPVDDMAEFLVYQNVCLSFEIERLKLIQLLGRRLGEARSDRLVAQILAASHALDPLADTNPFDDLLNDMPGSAKDRARKELHARWHNLVGQADPGGCREILIALVEENLERYGAMLESYTADADKEAERTVARLSVDQSPEGQRLWEQRLKCMRAFARGIETFRKYQLRQIRALTGHLTSGTSCRAEPRFDWAPTIRAQAWGRHSCRPLMRQASFKGSVDWAPTIRSQAWGRHSCRPLITQASFKGSVDWAPTIRSQAWGRHSCRPLMTQASFKGSVDWAPTIRGRHECRPYGLSLCHTK
jgi:hypothetical protein